MSMHSRTMSTTSVEEETFRAFIPTPKPMDDSRSASVPAAAKRASDDCTMSTNC